MALFLDSADLEEIHSGMELGIYSGVTTNPSLLADIPKEDHLDHLGAIAKICRKSLYAQVELQSLSRMEREALTLVEVAPGRTVIKVPMSAEGLRLCVRLHAKNIPVCMTAVFSTSQVFAAAAVGAHAAAVYVGRLFKKGEDGTGVVRKAAEILRAQELQTRILAASIPDIEALTTLLAIPGVDATIPASLQEPFLQHAGTQEAIDEFKKVSKLK
jgi:transaldolase